MRSYAVMFVKWRAVVISVVFGVVVTPCTRRRGPRVRLQFARQSFDSA